MVIKTLDQCLDCVHLLCVKKLDPYTYIALQQACWQADKIQINSKYPILHFKGTVLLEQYQCILVSCFSQRLVVFKSVKDVEAIVFHINPYCLVLYITVLNDSAKVKSCH